MSSPTAQVIFVPVLFCCQVGDERVCRTQYVAVPARSTMDDVKRAAQRELELISTGLRLEYAFGELIKQGQRPICGFEILPITAIPRPQ